MPPPRRTNYFQVEWMKKEYCNWLKPVKTMSDKGHCMVCSKNFDISNMGISAVASHAASMKHRNKLEENEKAAATQISLNVYVVNTENSDAQSVAVVAEPSTSSDTPSITPTCSSSALPSDSSVTKPTPSMPETQTSVTLFVQRESVTKAEILWTFKSVMSNYSFKFCYWFERVAPKYVPG